LFAINLHGRWRWRRIRLSIFKGESLQKGAAFSEKLFSGAEDKATP
jgi:hypothetical protein